MTLGMRKTLNNNQQVVSLETPTGFEPRYVSNKKQQPTCSEPGIKHEMSHDTHQIVTTNNQQQELRYLCVRQQQVMGLDMCQTRQNNRREVMSLDTRTVVCHYERSDVLEIQRATGCERRHA